ncbi:MAG: hypothetical protein F6K03_08975, partial [Kamptonema sp. SIO4C4]|nr:hypothetical protein [Kamptonema sp. SIO4C4]
MESWEFLLQKKGTRSWLPIKRRRLKIEAGQYRIVAQSCRANVEVEIRVIYQTLDEVPPKRRAQKRVCRTSQEGLMMVIPFTPLRQGYWEFRCTSPQMEDMTGEAWQEVVQLHVTPAQLPNQTPEPSKTVVQDPPSQKPETVSSETAATPTPPVTEATVTPTPPQPTQREIKPYTVSASEPQSPKLKAAASYQDLDLPESDDSENKQSAEQHFPHNPSEESDSAEQYLTLNDSDEQDSETQYFNQNQSKDPYSLKRYLTQNQSTPNQSEDSNHSLNDSDDQDSQDSEKQ